MNLTRRGTLLGGLGALALGACGSRPRDGAPATGRTALTVGLTYIPNIQFSPFYVGVREGIFDELGLAVTLRHHGAQEEAFGALLRGDEDVVFASSDEAVVASPNAPDLRTFATAYQTYPTIILVPETGARDVAQLAGRTVGIPGHFGSNYYGILAALHGAGMTERDVKLQDIGFTQVTALMTGKVDAVVGYSNNEAVQLAAAGFKARAIPVQDPARPSLVGPGLVTRDGHIPTAALRSLAEGMKRAEERIVADPGLALTATAEHVPALRGNQEREAASAVLDATAQLWLRDGEVSVAVDEAAFHRMGRFLTDVGIIAAPPSESVLAL